MVSSLSRSSAARIAVQRAQNDLTAISKEVTTGRLADVGLTLGTSTSRSYSLRAELDRVNSFGVSNGLVAQRFDMMQTALTSIGTAGDDLMSSLLANGTTQPGLSATVDQAKAALQQMASALNTSSGSRFLFSGASSDQAAVRFKSATETDANGDPAAVGGYADGSTAAAATAAVFNATFGTSQTGNGVANITASQLKAFLTDDNGFAKLFTDPAPGATGGWSNFSTVGSAPVYNSIDTSAQINTSYSAGSEAFRNIAKAYVMLSDLGVEGMSDESRKLLTSQASETLGKGLSQLTAMRGEIGASQKRIDDTSVELTSRSNVIKAAMNSLEGVDPYEASIRVTNLTTLLDTSYSVTARISRLSLLNYL